MFQRLALHPVAVKILITDSTAEFDEAKMVSCEDCEDYDLCLTCLLKDSHGHNPAHIFSLIREQKFCLKNLVLAKCRPGRQHAHAAICDGCDKVRSMYYV